MLAHVTVCSLGLYTYSSSMKNGKYVLTYARALGFFDTWRLSRLFLETILLGKQCPDFIYVVV